MEKRNKKEYRKPEVEDWGTVTDLTAVGNTNDGPDIKGGSVTNSQGS